ncbi:Flagellar hook-length control protein FliK [uncultured Gammaproteobacteria bacterium]|nr:Flagellar hook-length control protein FliK [uncultured Gammaproteobacteria bacterium]
MQLKKGTQRGFVIISESAGDESGWSVSSAGDVNGDGLDDLIVGAKNAKVGKEYSAGKSYVVFGKQDNTNTIDLSDIAYGIGGFVINGESAGNQSGYSVSNAGDVNGDGLDDLIVGTNTAKTGKSYVVFGKQDTDPIELSAITAGKGGFIINDESGRNFSGCLVSSAGDVNGDGLDDLIISAIYSGDQDNRFKPGKSYVVFGKKDNTAINLSDIAAGIGGFVINGESVSVSDDLYVMGRGMPAGHSVSSAGDVNGDGLDDLIVGARAADPSNKLNAGKSYVVFGKKDNTNAIELSDIVAGTGGFVINGELAYDKSGWSVSSAGDVNGDGLDDLIVGAYTADTGGSIYAIKKYNVGKSYVVFGKKDTYSIELSDISSGIGGFVIIGELADDKSGWSVSSAGDVNGDGLDDLIVGAYQATPRDKSSTGTPQIWGPDSSSKSKAGKSYVVFGKKDNTNAIELSDIAAGIGGFVIIGESVGDYSGCSVSNAGDVNGDGLDDLIVGAYDAKLSAGKSYVIFGKTDTGAIDLSKLGDKSKYTIDYLGDKNDNILTGTTKDEIFVAGAGNDTLTGNGGMDVLNAGTGDDTIIINASNIAALEKTGAGNRARVDGGGGTDTLKLEGAGLTLDLTKISDRRIQDIEVIDITGSGNNTLKFNLDDLLHTSTSANILKVLGNSGDEVVTTGFNDLVTNKTVNGVAYNVYTYGDTNAELWIQERVTLRKMQCGFVVNGESKHDYSGWSVSSAGDVNGDGVDDLIVGAYGANLSDKIDAGKSYVIFGKQDNTAINLSAIVAGTGGFVINGESARGWSGWSVSNAGDVNADGLDDLIIGAGQSDLSGKSNAGKSYVVFGKKDNTHAVELSDIAAGTGGFVINGESAGDFSGHSVSNAGDVNGDGLDDLIVGAYQANLSDKKNAGKSYVIFGKQDNTAINLSAIAAGTGGFVINGESKHDYSGWSVSSAGDVNGDGLDDLIIGALYADSNGKVDTGKSYIVFGKQDNTAINLSAIAAGTGGFVINGESRLNYSGSSVSSAGDVNGDGLDDLIVGAFQADPSGQSHAGKSYVVFGKKDNTDAIELSAIAAGTGGFVINGESARDFSGHSVSNAGDVNGDGLDDLIVGAYLADSNHQSQAGKSYVVFGKKDNTHAVKLSDIAAGIDGFVIIGESAGDYSGHSVSSAGDVNGDGLDDLIVGANGAKSSTGKSYVIFGKTDTGAIDLSKLGDEPKYTIDYLGDENANILTGTTKDEIFVAGAGNDILTGNGGMDVFNAGLGDDMIIINASNIAALEKTGTGNRARVDGGGGMDALKLEGAGLTLDLTKISDRRIQDIEVIDITGSGNNTLKLNLNDLLHASTSTNILKVLGNSGDKVMVIGFDDSTTEKTVYDITYTIYAHSNANTGANAELWVQKGVTLMGAQSGFVINGESANDDSGRSVSNAGDVNGDGLDDLIIGAWGANLSGKSNAGKSYVVFGKQDTDAVELSAIAAGKGGFVINGESIEDGSGYLVSNAGDVNGDGLDDLIVANYGGDPSKVHAVTGKSYVVFGKQGTDAIELSAIAAGKGGFIIKGESASFWSDHLASNAGDINGDGLDDLIISARETSDTSYVVFGKQDTDAVELSAIASGTGGFVIVGELTNDEYSHSISNAGDVNGDGLDDLIVGNEESNINGKLNAGKSYVVFGKKDNTNAIELSDIVAGKGGFVINGESEDDYSSFSISSAGDVNGDGLDDLIVGAYSADPSGKRSAGKSYVVFGKKTTPMPLNYQPLLLVQAQMALLSMASQRVIGVATQSPVQVM